MMTKHEKRIQKVRTPLSRHVRNWLRRFAPPIVWGLAVVAMLSAVISAYVYLRLLVAMWMKEDEAAADADPIEVPRTVGLALGIDSVPLRHELLHGFARRQHGITSPLPSRTSPRFGKSRHHPGHPTGSFLEASSAT